MKLLLSIVFTEVSVLIAHSKKLSLPLLNTQTCNLRYFYGVRSVGRALPKRSFYPWAVIRHKNGTLWMPFFTYGSWLPDLPAWTTEEIQHVVELGTPNPAPVRLDSLDVGCGGHCGEALDLSCHKVAVRRRSFYPLNYGGGSGRF